MTDLKCNTRFIAFYLPQFYPIPENDKWYGKGFTEWTNVAKAKPLFPGHYEPHVPADLGFYDMRNPETIKGQAKMAHEYGIDGFCYWHYWFGQGKTIMEKPFNAVLESGKPDFPFCLCWANHSWHNPATKEIILEQKYYDDDDHIAHFMSLLPAFKDHRYILYDNKPIFAIFEPESVPDVNSFIALWNRLAKENGFEGIYFIGLSQTPEEYMLIENTNLDAINTIRLKDFLLYQNKYKEFLRYKLGMFHDYPYEEALKHFISSEDINERTIPTIISGWDHSPRAGKNSLILTDYTPKFFEKHLKKVFEVVSKKQNKLCFIKAWNEWGEGNHLEPDLKYGLAFLETLKRVKEEYQ